MINAQLSHLALRAALARFYERVGGRVAAEPAGDGPWTLGWGQGHHVLEIASGEGPACVDHLALEVPGHDDLAALEQ